MSRKSTIIIKEKKIGLSERSNLLAPDTILDQVKQRISELQNLLIQKKTALKAAPEGTLRIAQSGNRIQYYHKTSENYPQGKYLPRNQDALAAALAQKDYDQRLVKEIEDEISALEKLTKNYNPSKIVEIFEGMHINRQHLINPSNVSDDAFEKAWSTYTYEGLPIDDNTPVFYTQKGEKVRSQAHQLIANTLNQLEIPYRYEYPLMINGSKGFSKGFLVHPTFYCLNVRTRKEFIWEHFNHMEDSFQAREKIGRISQYQSNGYFQGEKLIITFETDETPLDEKQVTLLAKRYLK